MFCPNSATHREIRALETEIAEDYAAASIGHAIRAAQDNLDRGATGKEADQS